MTTCWIFALASVNAAVCGAPGAGCAAAGSPGGAADTSPRADLAGAPAAATATISATALESAARRPRPIRSERLCAVMEGPPRRTTGAGRKLSDSRSVPGRAIYANDLLLGARCAKSLGPRESATEPTIALFAPRRRGRLTTRRSIDQRDHPGYDERRAPTRPAGRPPLPGWIALLRSSMKGPSGCP